MEGKLQQPFCGKDILFVRGRFLRQAQKSMFLYEVLPHSVERAIHCEPNVLNHFFLNLAANPLSFVVFFYNNRLRITWHKKLIDFNVQRLRYLHERVRARETPLALDVVDVLT